MRKLFEEYFVFILYVLTGLIVLVVFVNIVEGPILNYGLQNDQRDESNIHAEYEKIDRNSIYFNIVGRPLPYNTHFDWTEYVQFDDGQPYLNEDGTENMDTEHCFAIIKGQKIDLSSYVTTSIYVNSTPIEIESYTYMNEKPKEAEAQVVIVPYVLNWENIHIKKNVAFFVLPNDMLMTFTGTAYWPDGKTTFKNKRIVFKKGGVEMAVSDTDASGRFIIGIKSAPATEDLNNQNIMPLGDYSFEIEATTDAISNTYRITCPENTFNDDQNVYNLGKITLTE